MKLTTLWLAALAAALFTSGSQAATLLGKARTMGNGTVRTYAEVNSANKPTAIGLTISAGAFKGLPSKRNRTSRCADLNKNGRIDAKGECEGDYEFKLAMPRDLTKRKDIPFKWLGFNWNPEGHAPPPWELPHFDVHFYMMSQKEIAGIRIGPCGIFINCDDFKRAIKPVPAKYVHAEHISVKAAVGAMGNHLIDSKTPEMGKPPRKFTHTWIFGAYDGRISFYEPMITLDYLKSRPNTCVPIKQPKAWQVGGYYATKYCMRHHGNTGATTVSLEGLVYRKAQ